MIVTTIISWFTKNIKLVAVFIISILIAIVCFQKNQLEKKNKQIDWITNNLEFYQEQLSNNDIQNRTLKLTIKNFKQSKDSLLQQMNTVKEELKIKDKQLKQAQLQNQEIKIDTTFIVDSPDFIKEFKPNELTSLIITKKDSLLTAKIDIKNTQTLFISTKKEYKNKYKNWFKRLIHFDFKKRFVYRYQIHNSNPIIRVKETRLVEIEN